MKKLLLMVGLCQIFSMGYCVQAEEHLSEAPAGSFSIVVIPDTQVYKGLGTKLTPKSTDPVTNPIFTNYVNWTAKNLDRQNIVFVSHVGDIVDKNKTDQWELARQCMDVIHGKVPYGISVGNHDMTSKGDSTLFQQYFPKSRFEDFDWYGGCYAGQPMNAKISGNNANSYQLFSAGGMDFIFLHLECNAPDDVLDWANRILKEHSNRRALLTTHMGWGPLHKPKVAREYVTGEKGRMQWIKIHGKRGNTPQQMWEKCYSKQPHLAAVFSGDQSSSQAIRAATRGDHGNVIHEFLQDYKQASDGNGWLRLYRFLPSENRVVVSTFDPVTEELCGGTKLVPDRSQHQFEFEYQMQPAK